MKTLLLLCFFLATLVGRGSARQFTAPSTRFTQQQLREDLRVARQALEEGHSGLYRYASRAEIDRAFEAVSKSLDRPLDAAEFYRSLAPVVGAVKDGHTWVALPEHLEKELSDSTPLLPLVVRLVEGKPYVFRDLSAQGGRLAGMELRGVNSVAAPRLIQTMLAATRGDGDIMTGRLRRVESWRYNHYMEGWDFNKHLVGLHGLRAPYRVTLWDEEMKREEEVVLEGAALPALSAAWKSQFPHDHPSEADADFTLLDAGRVARLTIRTFAGAVAPGSKQELPEFLKESFEEMRRRGTKALILDLRGNTGGGDAYGRILLSYFVAEPFRYYEDLVMNKLKFDFAAYARGFGPVREDFARRGEDGLYHAVGHENWGVHQPSAQGFPGRVFVLMNGMSFSTTSEFLSHMHYRKLATFVGEEAGGGYYGNTSGFMPVVTLPHTKVRLRVPLITYFLAVKGSVVPSRGVMPDHRVRYTITELLAGRDKEFALALELARRSSAAR